MNVREFALASLCAVAGDGLFRRFLGFVRLLHKLRVYIFEVFIPLASCRYDTCNSATFVLS